MSLQEKFQIITPYSQKKDDDGNEWMHFNSARVSTDDHAKDAHFNEMPPGMEICQDNSAVQKMPLVMSGESDVSADTNASSFAEGYTRREFSGTEEQYTGEQVDLFYGEAVDEKGLVGFAERNNYLDRI